MKRQKPLTILSYAVNGIGMGHLTRLIAINTEIRRICALINQPLLPLFLTTSEADTLAHQHSFPAYKLPSMTVADEGRIPKSLYKSLSRHWIWNTFGLWKPDITLVDTFPAGSFGELPAILQDSPHNVFIHRAVKSDEMGKATFKEALRLYDIVLRIKEPSMKLEDTVDEKLHGEWVDISPIILEKRYSKEAYNQQGKCIIVFGGGGGDEYAETFWQTMARVAEKFPDKTFIFAVGMLYRGTLPYVQNVQYIRTEIGKQYYENCEFAISAGGFNSVYELLYYKIPTIFYSQYRKFDDQQQRIERLHENGLCCVGLFSQFEECVQYISSMTENKCEFLRKKLHSEKWTLGNINAAQIILRSYINNNVLTEAIDIVEANSQFFNTLSIEEEVLFLELLYSTARMMNTHGNGYTIALKVSIAREVWDIFTEHSLAKGEIKYLIQEIPKKNENAYQLIQQIQQIIEKSLKGHSNEIQYI